MMEPCSSENVGDTIVDLKVLIFDIMGTVMGVDLDQAERMLDLREAIERQISVYSFHEKVSFRASRIVYQEPRVLLIRDKEGAIGLLIDQPQDIVNVRTESIRPLPDLIGASGESNAIWGVALVKEEMVLLVDLHDLMACRIVETGGGPALSGPDGDTRQTANRVLMV
jgi:hypothetical protein